MLFSLLATNIGPSGLVAANGGFGAGSFPCSTSPGSGGGSGGGIVLVGRSVVNAGLISALGGPGGNVFASSNAGAGGGGGGGRVHFSASTIVAGTVTVVIENDQFVGRKGHGQYVKRGLSQYLV